MKTLPHVAKSHYKITAKGAGIINLDFTQIQHRLLYTLGKVLETRERAKIIVVKPRQIMSTTAFSAALFKLCNDIEGYKGLITTHRAKVTTEVFENLKRFQEQMPSELRVETTQMNDYKVAWKNLSEIVTGTAGTDSGRGFPCLWLMPSELGRYKERHVKDLQEGAMQAHASAEKASIFIGESTSGGEGNYFHELAVKGWRNPKSSLYTCFYGWHEMPEYQLPPPKGWVPDTEEVKLMKLLNCSVNQIYWRHVKLHDEMRGNLTGFQREYPSNFEEAFTAAEGRLIDSVVIGNCLNSLTLPDKSQPLVLGVDPAGRGGDRTVLIKRQGFYMFEPLIMNKMDDYTLTNIIIKMMDEDQIDHVFIDMGYGHGTYYNLRGLGRRNVTGVHFGGNPSPANKALYADRRTEMAAFFQDWCEEGPSQMGGTARLPNHPEFLTDIRAIPDLEYSGEMQKFKLATKDEIKEDNGGRSPDCFDAAILTLAAPVQSLRSLIMGLPGQNQNQGNTSILTTQNAFNEFGVQDNNGFNANTKYYSFGM